MHVTLILLPYAFRAVQSQTSVNYQNVHIKVFLQKFSSHPILSSRTHFTVLTNFFFCFLLFLYYRQDIMHLIISTFLYSSEVFIGNFSMIIRMTIHWTTITSNYIFKYYANEYFNVICPPLIRIKHLNGAIGNMYIFSNAIQLQIFFLFILHSYWICHLVFTGKTYFAREQSEK